MSSEAGTIFHASEMPRLAATTAIVIQGRASGRMPGISPGRSGLRRSVGMRDRRVGRSGRSSFGARFRKRVPQYGHSVTYGLTSEPHFLQMTKRSAPGISIDCTCARTPCRGDSDRAGHHDLGHDLAEVMVGLVDHELAGGAVAVADDVVEGLELVRGAQV